SVAKQQQSETNNVIANVKVKAEAETKADAEAEAKSKAKAEAIAKAKADAETAARAKANAEARAKARANVERKERMARETIAFKDAKVVKILDRKIDNVWPHATDRQNMTNGTLKVFWYDSRGSLTNCPAGFKEVMRLFYVSPKPDELAEKTSGAFLIWLDTHIDTNKVAYWDWSPLKNKKPEAWFATTDEVNLMEMCFGKRKEVRETWEKGVGGTFTIEYKVETKVRTSNETKVRTSKLKWKLIEGVEGNELLKVDNLVDEAMKKKKEKLEEEQKNRKKRIDDYKGQMSVASTKKGEYDSFTNQLAKVRQTLSDLNKNTKKNASEKKTEKDKSKEKTDLETKIRGLLVDEELKTCMSFCGHTLKYGDNKITGWEELLETCQTKIGKLEEEQKKEAANEKTMESRIRKDVKAGKYLIVKVEGGQ
ncbi:MAG: hypothetical protein IKS92_13085, partial [Victivallales bacterium]|nr:hypothetical protein [Victivallales bacterium]